MAKFCEKELKSDRDYSTELFSSHVLQLFSWENTRSASGTSLAAQPGPEKRAYSCLTTVISMSVCHVFARSIATYARSWMSIDLTRSTAAPGGEAWP